MSALRGRTAVSASLPCEPFPLSNTHSGPKSRFLGVALPRRGGRDRAQVPRRVCGRHSRRRRRASDRAGIPGGDRGHRGAGAPARRAGFPHGQAGHGEVRGEEEIELSSEQFDALWPLTEGSRVEKRRHYVEHEGLTFEVDVFRRGSRRPGRGRGRVPVRGGELSLRSRRRGWATRSLVTIVTRARACSARPPRVNRSGRGGKWTSTDDESRARPRPRAPRTGTPASQPAPRARPLQPARRSPPARSPSIACAATRTAAPPAPIT